MTSELHSCNYQCERPECIRAQRDELASRLAAETSNARGEWVLVPREPTREMEHEGIGVAEWTGDVKVIWSAMLAAAPPPAAARGDVRGLVALAEQMERDAAGCRRDGYTDAAVVKEDCAQRIRQTLGISAIAEALAAEGVQAGDVEQRARELLAAEYQKHGHGRESAEARASYIERHECAAFDAIARALSQQPEAKTSELAAEYTRGLMDGFEAAQAKPEARGVVDGAMVRRAMDAYWANGLDESEDEDFESMRRALTAALTGERNG